MYSGRVEYAGYSSLVRLCSTLSADNVLLLLNTVGGSPDYAYKIAKYLQNRFKSFTLMVSCMCKSAGTLIAIGANELVLSDEGELGPLDVQLRKDHEVGEVYTSGLDVTSALDTLNAKTLETFSQFLYGLRLGGRLSTEVASTMATSLVGPLYRSLFRQIDPIALGNVTRSLEIASAYGIRLDRKGKNLKPGALSRLISGYPSHGFVIDLDEATELFKNVRRCNPVEANLANVVAKSQLENVGQSPPTVIYLGGKSKPQPNATSGPASSKKASPNVATNPDGGINAQSEPASTPGDGGSRAGHEGGDSGEPATKKPAGGQPAAEHSQS